MPLILERLPISTELTEDEITVDGGWIAERIITSMPIIMY